MFLKEVQVSNFRLFPAVNQPDSPFSVSLGVPDGQSEGSGLTALVGENGCGKTTLLDAIALPILPYKAEGFSLEDFNNPSTDVEIKALSNVNFSVQGTMPNSNFDAKGFSFKANVRSRGNKAYLSSIIASDQLFIKAGDKPRDGSPDLRVSVNNPFSGKRFDETDVVSLEKNRTNQTRGGTFNSTGFDHLMEDFDFQYIKRSVSVQDVNETVERATYPDELNLSGRQPPNQFLCQAIEKFKEVSKRTLSLNLIENWKPHSNAFLAENRINHQQIPLRTLGSGYEMIFSLLWRFYLAKQSGKQLVYLVDEPELHLHPALQEQFVKILLEFSKDAQIVLSTHSPLLVKQLSGNDNVGIQILSVDNGTPTLTGMQPRVLPYVSANEINYCAFGLATVEYHNELYGHIQETQQKGNEMDMIEYLNTQALKSDRKWTKESNGSAREEKDVPLQVFIRNKIHHPENKTMQTVPFSPEDLKQSIQEMVGIIRGA